MTVLAEFRTSLGRMLATAVDSALWPNDLLDEALRNALYEFAERGPTLEATATATDGYEQDVGVALAELHSIVQIAWPWEADRIDPLDWAAPFRLLDDGLIWLEGSNIPTAGDLIRVVYRPLWWIEDLDNATITTVRRSHERVITTVAAYYACLLRLRQLSENPKLVSTQTDDTLITVTSGDRTTTVTNGGAVTTTVTGIGSKETTSGDTTVTTSANNNQFPPIPTETVTTDNPTVAVAEENTSTSAVSSNATVTTVEDIPTTEAARSTLTEQYLHDAMIAALEKALAHFRTLADERLARINGNGSTFVNPSWAGVGL